MMLSHVILHITKFHFLRTTQPRNPIIQNTVCMSVEPQKAPQNPLSHMETIFNPHHSILSRNRGLETTRKSPKVAWQDPAPVAVCWGHSSFG